MVDNSLPFTAIHPVVDFCIDHQLAIPQGQCNVARTVFTHRKALMPSFIVAVYGYEHS